MPKGTNEDFDIKKMPCVPLPDIILLAGGRGTITKGEFERQVRENELKK